MKQPLGFGDLAAHLQSIGIDGDVELMRRRLADVGYYRLSPYWRVFRVDPRGTDPTLVAGTRFEQVWRIYTFDRELRLLALDALERVEVAVRSRVVQVHVMKHGPFGYAEPATPSTTAPLQDDRRREDLLARVRKECDRARDDAPVRHFLDVYGDDHDHPPLWLAAELFSFGDLVTLYRDSWRSVRKEVADDFGVSEEVLGSWLLSLNFVRNVCANHGRLWNREIRVRPQVPRNPIWRHQVLEATNRVFFTLTALAHLLGIISEGTSWARRFRDLLARYPDVPLRAMGLREGWEQHPVWAPRLATDP